MSTATKKTSSVSAFDKHGIPIHVKHFRNPGMRSDVWDCIHALEKPIKRGSKMFSHVCLACVKAISVRLPGHLGWEEALCRVSNTSNAMKHMKSRHKEWVGHAITVNGGTKAAMDGEKETTTNDQAVSSGGGTIPAGAGTKRKAENHAEDQDAAKKRVARETQRLPMPQQTNNLLSDKVVVITGASGGIGAAIAKRMAVEGAMVALGARRIEALETTRDQIYAATASRANVLIKATDVTKRQDLHSLVKAATDKFGDVDILVNNAGVMPFELLRNVNQDSWDKVVDINCKGVLNGIASVLPRMLERKSGHIVNISSDAGRKVFPGLGVYSASKMFVEAVSQALRLENVGSGLKVTCIQPGNVATDLVQNGNTMAGVDEEAIKLYGTPSGYQILHPDDVANAVFYAVSQPPFVAVNEVLVEPRDEPI